MKCLEPYQRKAYCRLGSGGSPAGLTDDRKSVNLMTVHVSKSVTAHEVSNNKHKWAVVLKKVFIVFVALIHTTHLFYGMI
jgi:hypothetical protein